jgi:hypothetical protein
MALNRADITQYARDVMNNQEVQVLDVNKVYRAFNRFYRRHSREIGMLSQIYQTDLVALQQEYPTPDRTYEIRRVMVVFSADSVTPIDLIYMRIDDLPPFWQAYPGFPQFWTARGISSVFLYQKPSATITNGLWIDYFYEPDDLALDPSDDDTDLGFNTIHEDALGYGLAAELVRYNLEDPNLQARLAYLEGQYQFYLGRVTESERNPDNDPVVSCSTGTYMPSTRGRLPGNWG